MNNTLSLKNKDNNADAYNHSQRDALHQRLLVQLRTHARPAELQREMNMKKRNIYTLYMPNNFLFGMSGGSTAGGAVNRFICGR